MKLLKALIFSLLCASPAFAALTANCAWSIISGGSTNNGGMFDPSQTAGMLTNLASTSSSSATPTFSSASYTFVAGDVGNWVFVGAGSGWVTGLYKITSLSGNNAVVDAAIGHVITYSATAGYGLSTVAGCGATASGTFSVDYAGPGQTADSVTNSTFASVGSSTNLTDGSSIFTPVMVGNAVHITNAGTGSFGLTQWFTITAYTNATTVVTDRTTNTGTAMVAGTAFIGGAVADIANINSASAGLGPIAGNSVWMGGSYTETTTVIAIAFSGTSTAPITVAGYATYWGDGYQGRQNGGLNGNGALVTTNMPTLTFTTGRLNFGGVSWIVAENLNVVATGIVASSSILCAINGAVVHCVANSATTSNTGVGIGIGGVEGTILDDDAILTGATGSTQGISLGSSGARAIACRVTMSSSNAACYGIVMSNTDVAAGNQVIGNNAGIGIYFDGAGAAMLAYGNTVVGFTDDVNIVTSTTVLECIVNNNLTDCVTNPLNMTGVSNAAVLGWNRYRQGTGGSTTAITNGGGWTTATNFSPTITGLSATDYNSLTDLRLVTGSPALGAGIPKSAATGAIQSPASGAGEVSSSNAR